jgi:predicted ATPase
MPSWAQKRVHAAHRPWLPGRRRTVGRDMVDRTPDQRLRVFVSSVADELDDERAAAVRAIESLRLRPVVFEVDAPDSRDRLEESHVFLAIYGQSYGPGPRGFRLEEQYELAEGRPRLIYVKRPAPNVEKPLAELLARIKRDALVSYKPFHDAVELEQLVENDVALLLTEQFHGGGTSAVEPSTAVGPATNLPARTDRFIGRERELKELIEILTESDDRLITLTGPGGTGKTRLALEAAARCASSFEDGAYMVALGSVTRPEVVVPTIVHALNVQGSSVEPIAALIEYLRRRRMLLFLDNFEQVVGAAPEIARVIEASPRVKLLVTSRALLNIRVEREFPVPPLGLPVAGAGLEDTSRHEAVSLFVDRARAIRPDFELTETNAAAVAAICRRLDGLPLALELAAARVRVMDPEAMLARLESSLRLLTKGARDAPERHRTLRAAIDWSFDLLDEDEKALFVRLGVFRGGCTLAAAERVCNAPGPLDVLELMGSLLDKSLVKHRSDGPEPRFRMLHTVWEYADELLDQSSEAGIVRGAHAECFMELVSSAHNGLRSSGQVEWLARLEADHDNLRAAMRWSLEHGTAEKVAQAGWTLWLFWWLDSHLEEGRRLMEDTLEHDDLSQLARARASAAQGVMAFWQSDYGEGIPLLATALEVFRAEEEPAGVALCQLPLAFTEAAMGAGDDAMARFEESVRHFKETGDEWGAVMSLNARCWTAHAIGIQKDSPAFEEALERAQRLGTELDIGLALRNLGCHRADQGRFEEARELLARALRTLWRGYVRGGTSYTIDGIAEVAATLGAHWVAARLFGATDAAREATRSSIIPMYAPRFRRFVDGLRRDMGGESFGREWEQGRALGMEGAVHLGLAWARREIDESSADEVTAVSGAGSDSLDRGPAA